MCPSHSKKRSEILNFGTKRSTKPFEKALTESGEESFNAYCFT